MNLIIIAAVVNHHLVIANWQLLLTSSDNWNSIVLLVIENESSFLIDLAVLLLNVLRRIDAERLLELGVVLIFGAENCGLWSSIINRVQ